MYACITQRSIIIIIAFIYIVRESPKILQTFFNINIDWSITGITQLKIPTLLTLLCQKSVKPAGKIIVNSGEL